MGNVTIVKCQCGSKVCNRYGLSEGIFYQGAGWDKDRAQQYADAINAYDDFQGDATIKRGLVIISALVNFIDWLDRETGKIVIHLTKKQRGELIKEFLDFHSKEKNYFLQASDIAERLGVPFKNDDQL